MNNIILSTIEFLSNLEFSNLILFILFIVFSAQTFLSLITFIQSKYDKGIIIKEDIQIISIISLLIFSSFFFFQVISPKSLKENTCFTRTYKNPFKLDKEYLAMIERKVNEYNQSIDIGTKLGAKNIDELIKSKDYYTKLLEKEKTDIEQSKKYPLSIEYFVLSNKNNKMTVISSDKNIFQDQVVELISYYSFKRNTCSIQISSVADAVKKEMVSFKQ